ncbi:MAG TPA: CAP domain-containing protein [Polyangiaceae bacterium]|jgi:uncharacterized protein YkwD|nr:CAP domain-containing protein [Polyangiaceae bacterium]
MRQFRSALRSQLAFVVVCAACGAASADATAPARGVASPPVGASPPSHTTNEPAIDPPAGALTLAQARRYMLDLINRDRRSMGLAPVTLDLDAPTAAGQRHAEDMASHAYLGHWGTDGSVPEQRMTEAGGVDMVLENASCFTDERPRRLDRAARFEAKDIEQTEAMFFHEKPLNDGHRKNILTPWHTRVGIGLAQPVATPVEIPVPCVAQEFVDSYGSYAPVPRTMHVGDMLHVQGTVAAPASFAGVGLARVDPPKALPVAEANGRRSYPVPAPYQTYWPAGYKTPIPVRVDGTGHFAIDVPVSDGLKPGMYELSVWAKVPGSPDFVMASLRTIQAR